MWVLILPQQENVAQQTKLRKAKLVKRENNKSTGGQECALRKQQKIMALKRGTTTNEGNHVKHN
jgi:hypothetical protein